MLASYRQVADGAGVCPKVVLLHLNPEKLSAKTGMTILLHMCRPQQVFSVIKMPLNRGAINCVVSWWALRTSR